MIAVYFHTQRVLEVDTILTNLLAMKVYLPRESFMQLRLVFVQNVLSESGIAKRSVQLRPQSDREEKATQDSLAIHVVYRLMQASIFDRAGVDARPWIFATIQSAALPLPQVIIQLVQTYADSVITSKVITRINEIDILRTFPRGQSPNPSQVLLLFFILYLNDKLSQLNQTTPQTQPPTATTDVEKLIEYADNILEKLPIKQILLYVESPSVRDEFKSLYPSLLSLIGSQYPEFLNVVSFLQNENDSDTQPMLTPYDHYLRLAAKFQPQAMGESSAFEVPDDVIKTCLKECVQSPQRAMLCLEYLLSMEAVQVIKYFDAISGTFFPAVLHERIDKRILTSFVHIFRLLNTIVPRELWARIVNAWRMKNSKFSQTLSHQDLVENPLKLFECDPRVFKRHELVEVFLQILDCYLTASRHLYTRKLSAVKKKNQAINETHLAALVDLQESSVLQLLIELCQVEEESKSNDVALVRKSIMFFLHQKFIHMTNHLKLLHFQGYSDTQIPLMVAEVPSMHVCLDFLPELLAQPQLDKQVFAIQLAGLLFEKYPLPASHALAMEAVLPKIHSIGRMAVQSPQEKEANGTTNANGNATSAISSNLTMILKTMPILVNIVRAFPTTVDDVMKVIVGIMQTKTGIEPVEKLRVEIIAAIEKLMDDPNIANKSRL
ncbi:Integrator complex subunit 2 [Blyttiomyces sp. JEL0837]|nr:Integrator complex subunit 2 [Blyttiomyces sp. JEL0837]